MINGGGQECSVLGKQELRYVPKVSGLQCARHSNGKFWPFKYGWLLHHCACFYVKIKFEMLAWSFPHQSQSWWIVSLEYILFSWSFFILVASPVRPKVVLSRFRSLYTPPFIHPWHQLYSSCLLVLQSSGGWFRQVVLMIQLMMLSPHCCSRFVPVPAGPSQLTVIAIWSWRNGLQPSVQCIGDDQLTRVEFSRNDPEMRQLDPEQKASEVSNLGAIMAQGDISHQLEELQASFTPEDKPNQTAGPDALGGMEYAMTATIVTVATATILASFFWFKRCFFLWFKREAEWVVVFAKLCKQSEDKAWNKQKIRPFF